MYMRVNVKLYTYNPFKFFSKCYLEILSNAIVFQFQSNTFTINYSNIMFYNDYDKYIIIKIKNTEKQSVLLLRIVPVTREIIRPMMNQLNIFTNNTLKYVNNPML